MIAERFNQTAKQAGAEVRTYSLHKIRFFGCQACQKCKQGPEGECVLRDDLTELLKNVHAADILVIATPVYFGDVNHWVGAFLERTYSYLRPDFMSNPQPCRLPPGKKLVFIQVQGAAEGSHMDIFRRYGFYFRFYGFDDLHLIQACETSDPSQIATRPDILSQAEDLATRLCAPTGQEQKQQQGSL
jgi:multimeric flavodoxin WrbA